MKVYVLRTEFTLGTAMSDNHLASQGQILLYQTEDGNQRIEVHLQNETVWLSQKV